MREQTRTREGEWVAMAEERDEGNRRREEVRRIERESVDNLKN